MSKHSVPIPFFIIFVEIEPGRQQKTVGMQDELKYSIDMGWRIRAEDLNLNMPPILKKAQLPLDLFERVDAEVTVDEYFRLFQAVGDSFPDKIYALEFEKVLSVESLSVPLYAILHSPNMKECFLRYKRFEKITSPTIMSFMEEKNSFIIDLEYQPSTIEPPSVFVELILVLLVKLARLGTRQRIVPKSVVTKRRMDKDAYLDYFGIYPKLGDANRIVFDQKDLKIPFLTHDELIWGIHEPELQKSVDLLDKKTSYISKVQSVILEVLPSGICDIDSVAEKLNISRRTLQRNLEAESTSFSDLLNKIRERKGRYYLSETSLTCEEISFMLGYDHPSSFSRAFTAWVGKSPQNLREELLS